jgi:hypothetical protein
MAKDKVGEGKKFSRAATNKEFMKRVQEQAGFSGVVSPELYKFLLSGSSQNDRDKIKKQMQNEGYDFRNDRDFESDENWSKRKKKVKKVFKDSSRSLGEDTIGKFSKGGAVKGKKKKSIDGCAIKGYTKGRR